MQKLDVLYFVYSISLQYTISLSIPVRSFLCSTELGELGRSIDLITHPSKIH